ncbi:glutathione S-transferase family protein [Zavarzinia sp. CC-PAN008]|uniref:glutathione S-transferase family protein n=1 Tax=Zavarzinia sp. CC-PAN008 TaxID=3243332 RepID=UPI003F74A783
MSETRRLVIGNKNWSSWSLRPWLALRMAGIPFEEVMVRLRQPDTAEQIARHSPTGKIPVLIERGVVIAESLAICEWAAEFVPEAGLWPDDPLARAVARAAAAEMHAGFMPLRRDLPMEIAARHPLPDSPEAAANIARVLDLWRQLRATYGQGGDFLFGRFGVVDAMFAPVVTRFTTYGVALDPVTAAYVHAVEALPAMQDWAAAARAEAG